MSILSQFFVLRGTLPKRTNVIVGILGFFVLICLWQVICSMGFIPQKLLPSPVKILLSFNELHFDDALIRNAFYSIKLNLMGYAEAIAVAIPLGFMIGLFPVFRASFNKYIDALRFVPLAAATGMFIAWFGIYDNMKIQFLAVSIIVYLLPVVVQRIDEVEQVYEQTAFTLGANRWQMIRTVFIPSVCSKLSDDIRVLVAISWTYITIAEALNMTGGIGALAYKSARQGRVDKVFAILVVIVLIGFLQDKFFKKLDKIIFPHKYA